MQPQGSNLKKDNPRLTIRWKNPPIGWIKGNFDGVAKGNLGREGCGGILRDHVGNIIDAIVVPIGHYKSHISEATAALYTMKLVADLGCPKLWLEGDSNIINILSNKISITWSIEAMVMEIKSLINKFEKVIISHTYREANGVADWVANHAVQMGYKMTWIGELNKNVDLKALINYDATHAWMGKIFQD